MKIKYLRNIQYLLYACLVVNFLVLTLTNEGCINGYVFLWMMMISLMLCYDISKIKKVKMILSVLIFVPLIIQCGIINQIMTAAACIVVLCLRKNVNKETSYEQVAYPMKIMIPVAIIVLLLSYLEPGSGEINEFIMPYVITYMIVSIVILRMMRDFKYGALNKRAVKVRSVYVALGMILVAIGSLEQVRAAIGKVIDVSSSFLGKVLYPFEAKIINFSGDVIRKFGSNVDISNLHGAEMNRGAVGGERVESCDGVFWKMQGAIKAAYIIVGVAFLLLLLYCFIRLQCGKRKKCSDFVEIREQIYKRENIEHKNSKKLYLKLKKGNYKEQIRYYYYKFLKDCSRKNVAVNASDTTYEINKKAEMIFKQKALEKMRNLYIKAKYTECECTVEDFEIFHKSYKEK